MRHTSYLIKKYHRRLLRRWLIIGLVLILAGTIGYLLGSSPKKIAGSINNFSQKVSQPSPTPIIKTGKIIEAQPEVVYSAEETKKLINQTSKHFDKPISQGITKQLVRYTSSDGDDNDVAIYGRIYKPAGVEPGKKLPIFAFAPGTTGIDDHCAASLEVPSKSNWANYDSLLAAYASQGYIVVTTDYEGMRDNTRMHHYMVGELEGKALLDGVRSLKQLDTTKNLIDSNKVALAGYSQGGHAAYWADQISSSYAPEMKIAGVVGFGPVSSVQETWGDITKGANINWFGPFVLLSYSDYYKKDYKIQSILLDRWATNLKTDVAKNCIDTVINYWGRKSDKVYQATFLEAIKNNNLVGAGFASLASDLDKNNLKGIKTASAKLINQGLQDNVILPRQSEAFRSRLCGNGNQSVVYRTYSATHYNTMVNSFNDTFDWLNQTFAGNKPAGNCPS